MAYRWPLRLAPVGPVAMGGTLWRLEGQLMATIVAKVTASFAVDGVTTLVAAAPVRHEDEHAGGHPMRSIVGARELAPQLHQVDVLMVGHAYPESGAAQTRVRLAMERAGAWVLNKMVTVYGDREGGGPPQPFDKLRLGWEKAYGGIGHADNPLGTGFGSTTTKAPNLLYSDGRDTPACFGPIPPSFPNRKKLLGGIPRKQVTEGIADLPATFDWRYFQAAPKDQRLDTLQGDEWLHLEGVHPSMRRIRTRLPGVHIATKVYGADAVGAPNGVPLRPDMVLVEPDELRVAIVYRGSFPIMTPGGLSALTIAAGVETADEPMLWPESVDDLEVLPHEIPHVSRRPPADDGPPSTAAPRPAPPATKPMATPAAPPLDGTFALSPEEVSAATGQPLPFAASRSDSSPPSSPPPDDAALPFGREPVAPPPPPATPEPHPLEGTVSITDDDPEPASLPFDGSRGDRKPPSSAPSDIPGAPWAKTPAPPVIPPQPGTAVTADGKPAQARTLTADLMNQELGKMRGALRAEWEAVVASQSPPDAVPPAPVPVDQADSDPAPPASKDEARASAEDEASEAAAKARAEALAAEEAARQQEDEEQKRRAAAEAEARRREEAEKFRTEQEEAEREVRRKAEEEAAKKREAAKKLRDNIYGGFKRRG